MKKIFLSLLCFSECLFGFGQLDTAHITVIGGVNSDECREVIELRNGGYIIVGITASFGQGNTDIYLIRTDTGGICMWSETIGESGIDRGYSVKETFDGGLIIAGYTNGYGALGYDVFLARTDSTGILLWTKTYGGSDWDFGYSVQQSADSGFVVCGESYSYSNGDADLLVVKTDKNGNLSWIKNAGGVFADAGYSITISREGNYIVAGRTISYGNGDNDAYVVAFNAAGDTLWTKTYGGAMEESSYGIDTTSDNGLIFIGSTSSFGQGGADVYLVKLDSIGNMQWHYEHGGPGEDVGHSVRQCTDDGYLFAASANSWGLGGYGAYIVRTDAAGNQMGGGPTFGDADDDYGYSVILTSTGGAFVGGATKSYGHGFEDIYLIKLPDDLIVQDYALDIRICNDTPIVAGVMSYSFDSFVATVHPNPFHDWTEISFNTKGKRNHVFHFEVFDLLGQRVYATTNITSNKIKFHRKNLKSGLYYFFLSESSSKVVKGKFLID